MNWQFADLTLNGHEYTVTLAEGRNLFVTAHFSRWMPKSVRMIRTSRRINPKGKLGKQLVALARQKWEA